MHPLNRESLKVTNLKAEISFLLSCLDFLIVILGPDEEVYCVYFGKPLFNPCYSL